ncbi:uncharacterized [Tachysurus ichikawai]
MRVSIQRVLLQMPSRLHLNYIRITCSHYTRLALLKTHTVGWYSKQKPTVGGVDISSSYSHRLITAVVACDKADRVYGLW